MTTQEEEIDLAIYAGQSWSILEHWLGRVAKLNAYLAAYRRAGNHQMIPRAEAEIARVQARIDTYVAGLKLW